MKKLFVLAVPVFLAACGGEVSPPVTGTIVSAPVQLDPFTEQPLPAPKPVQKPAAQTGSAYLPEPILLAQNNNMPQIYMQPPKLIGTDTLETIKATIKEPPPEISPCFGAVLTHNVPVVDKQYQYNGWWLLGAVANNSTNFYWATQVSANQVGAVPSGYVASFTEPPEARFDLGYAQLPYQWVSRLGYYSGFPVNPDEKCAG